MPPLPYLLLLCERFSPHYSTDDPLNHSLNGWIHHRAPCSLSTHPFFCSFPILYCDSDQALLTQTSSKHHSQRIRGEEVGPSHIRLKAFVCFLWSILPKSERHTWLPNSQIWVFFFSIALIQPVYSMNVSISHIIFRCFRLWTLNMTSIPLRCCCVDV